VHIEVFGTQIANIILFQRSATYASQIHNQFYKGSKNVKQLDLDANSIYSLSLKINLWFSHGELWEYSNFIWDKRKHLSKEFIRKIFQEFSFSKTWSIDMWSSFTTLYWVFVIVHVTLIYQNHIVQNYYKLNNWCLIWFFFLSFVMTSIS